MLRDARQVAIQEVVEALLEAAHVHRQGVALLEGEARAPTLAALAERRQQAALGLGEHVRRLGDLPSEPDADVQTARDIIARLQVALADDEREEILQHSRDAEAHLAETVRAALDEDLPRDTREVLEDLLQVPELAAALGAG